MDTLKSPDVLTFYSVPYKPEIHEQYVVQCRALEKALAAVLNVDDAMFFPMSDDGLCFRLAIKYGVSPTVWKGAVWIGSGDEKHFQHEQISYHPDTYHAARVAVAKAVLCMVRK